MNDLQCLGLTADQVNESALVAEVLYRTAHAIQPCLGILRECLNGHQSERGT
jgi:hypothetical protein